MENKEKASGGMSFLGVLQTVFIVLKLCKIIKWPWIFVFTPMWISFALVVVIFVALIALAVINR